LDCGGGFVTPRRKANSGAISIAASDPFTGIPGGQRLRACSPLPAVVLASACGG
jgi:hypothetical protein